MILHTGILGGGPAHKAGPGPSSLADRLGRGEGEGRDGGFSVPPPIHSARGRRGWQADRAPSPEAWDAYLAAQGVKK